MKKTLLLFLLIPTLAFSQTFENADTTITKVGDNHVIIYKTLYDKDGSGIVVDTKEYGQIHINSLLLKAQAEKKRWEDYKKDLKAIDIEIAKAQVKIDFALSLQTEMDKVVSEIEGE